MVRDWKRMVRRWGIPTLAALGLAISGYLLAIDLSGDPALCLGSSGCEVVRTSPYARVLGVPVALLGVGLYAVLLALSLAPSQLPEPLPRYAPLSIYGLSLAGVLFSAYLTYVEIFVLGAICLWCVASAVDVTTIWILAVWMPLQPAEMATLGRGSAARESKPEPSRRPPRGRSPIDTGR